MEKMKKMKDKMECGHKICKIVTLLFHLMEFYKMIGFASFYMLSFKKFDYAN